MPVADGRRSRWWILVFGLAAVLAALSAAFVVVSMHERDDARRSLRRARVVLRSERAANAHVASNLAHARQTARGLAQQLAAIPGVADGIAALDDRDLELVRAAVQAGLAGTVSDYNEAVDQHNALDALHDAALERLRVEINSLIVALDALRD
jgi:hypothetical protein